SDGAPQVSDDHDLDHDDEAEADDAGVVHGLNQAVVGVGAGERRIGMNHGHEAGGIEAIAEDWLGQNIRKQELPQTGAAGEARTGLQLRVVGHVIAERSELQRQNQHDGGNSGKDQNRLEALLQSVEEQSGEDAGDDSGLA